MIKAVIFDLDGVLIHTDHLHYLAWKKMADLEEIEFNPEINNRLRGISRLDSLNIILEKATRSYSDEEKEGLANAKNNFYKYFLTKLGPKDVDEEVRQLLNTLKSKGVKIAIASSSTNARLILKQLDLSSMFDVICDGTMVEKSKPSPDIFIKASELLALDPSECAVVEDARAGIDAANTVGFLTIGINNAYDYSETKMPIQSLSEIIKIV